MQQQQPQPPPNPGRLNFPVLEYPEDRPEQAPDPWRTFFYNLAEEQEVGQEHLPLHVFWTDEDESAAEHASQQAVVAEGVFADDDDEDDDDARHHRPRDSFRNTMVAVTACLAVLLVSFGTAAILLACHAGICGGENDGGNEEAATSTASTTITINSPNTTTTTPRPTLVTTTFRPTNSLTTAPTFAPTLASKENIFDQNHSEPPSPSPVATTTSPPLSSEWPTNNNVPTTDNSSLTTIGNETLPQANVDTEGTFNFTTSTGSNGNTSVFWADEYDILEKDETTTIALLDPLE